jgi:hypothetical protein
MRNDRLAGNAESIAKRSQNAMPSFAVVRINPRHASASRHIRGVTHFIPDA